MRPFTLVCASERHSHVVHCRWHYYLLDFCYFANALMLAHLWLLPHSALLHKARARSGCLVPLRQTIEGRPALCALVVSTKAACLRSHVGLRPAC